MGIPLPALNIRPPAQPADPLEQFSRLQAIRSSMMGQQLQQGQQQLQQQQIQGATQENQMRQIQLQDTQAGSAAMHEWDGKDINDLPGLYIKHGASPNAVLSLKTSIVDQQTKLATLDKTTLDNLKTKHDNIAGALDSITDLPAGQQQAAFEKLKTDPDFLSNLNPQERAQLPSLQYQGADWLRQMANEHLAESQLTENALKRQQTATSVAQQGRFTSQAAEANANTAKIAGAADPNSPFYKPTDDYLNARAAAGDPQAQAILDARAKQAGNVAGAQEAAKLPFAGPKAAAEAAAKLPYETQLKQTELGPQPAIAVDPQTKQRVLTTLGDAQKQGLTNPIKATQTDVEKAGEFNAQANDVQMNTSRYKVALNSVKTPFSPSEVANVTHILSDPNVNNAIANAVGMPAIVSMVEQGAKARDWNALSPDKQEALIGYLRMKGAAIAYQKMLTNQGRTSKEGLDIELANIPSPIMGATAANKQLQAFQENIDTAAQRSVKLPWMETPAEVRRRIEGAPQQTPQPTGKYKASSGRTPQVGELIPFQGSSIKVSQVFPDGTFNAQ